MFLAVFFVSSKKLSPLPPHETESSLAGLKHRVSGIYFCPQNSAAPSPNISCSFGNFEISICFQGQPGCPVAALQAP